MREGGNYRKERRKNSEEKGDTKILEGKNKKSGRKRTKRGKERGRDGGTRGGRERGRERREGQVEYLYRTRYCVPRGSP